MVGHGAVMQAAVEELRGLRAAEESALTALADEELAARFNGDVTLTVRDDAVTVLSPDQVGPTLSCTCDICADIVCLGMVSGTGPGHGMWSIVSLFSGLALHDVHKVHPSLMRAICL